MFTDLQCKWGLSFRIIKQGKFSSNFRIAGFQCHAIQNRSKSKSKPFNRKSGIWEIKGGKYTKTLAKIQARRIFRIPDIRRNVLPKFIDNAGAHLDEHQHGGRKPTKTSGTKA